MKFQINLTKLPWNKPQSSYRYSIWNRFHLDPILFLGTIAFMVVGLLILYSASNESMHVVEKQGVRF